jgi:hypothetical protein
LWHACPRCSIVGFKPIVELSLSAKVDASANASIQPSITVVQSLAAGYDKQRGGAFLDFPPRDISGKVAKELKVTACSLSVNADLNGGAGLVVSWLETSELTDLFTVTVPYFEWKHPLELKVSSEPFTTPEGRQCNMCNAACPSAKFSLVPVVNWGAKVCYGTHQACRLIQL